MSNDDLLDEFFSEDPEQVETKETRPEKPKPPTRTKSLPVPEDTTLPATIEQIDRQMKRMEGDQVVLHQHIGMSLEKAQNAIDECLDIANTQHSARAFEVAGQLMKTIGELSERYVTLYEKLENIREKRFGSAKQQEKEKDEVALKCSASDLLASLLDHVEEKRKTVDSRIVKEQESDDNDS